MLCWNGAVIFKMVDKFGQCANFIFYMEFGISGTERLEILPWAFGNQSLNQMEVFAWSVCLKAVQVSVEFDECSA